MAVERITVTLEPELKSWGEEQGVNFSQLLRDAVLARKNQHERQNWTPEKTQAFKTAIDEAVKGVSAAFIEWVKPNGAAGEEPEPRPMDSNERRERAMEIAEIKAGVLNHRFSVQISPDSLYKEARLKLNFSAQKVNQKNE